MGEPNAFVFNLLNDTIQGRGPDIGGLHIPSDILLTVLKALENIFEQTFSDRFYEDKILPPGGHCRNTFPDCHDMMNIVIDM